MTIIFVSFKLNSASPIPGGDLHYHLSQHGVFSEKEMRFYATEIILGLEHMHSRFVVYRDLKVRPFDRLGVYCTCAVGVWPWPSRRVPFSFIISCHFPHLRPDEVVTCVVLVSSRL